MQKWLFDLDLQCSFPSLMMHEKWKWINLSRTGLNFLCGQMSIQRNYKVGLLHFHCLRSCSKVIHKPLSKAQCLFFRQTLWGKFLYHHRVYRTDDNVAKDYLRDCFLKKNQFHWSALNIWTGVFFIHDIGWFIMSYNIELNLSDHILSYWKYYRKRQAYINKMHLVFWQM